VVAVRARRIELLPTQLLSLLALDADGAPGALMLRSAVERKAMFGVDETTNLCAGGYARRLPAYRRQGPARVESRAGRRARRDILDRAGATGGARDIALGLASPLPGT
jgi:hypothetical protein